MSLVGILQHKIQDLFLIFSFTSLDHCIKVFDVKMQYIFGGVCLEIHLSKEFNFQKSVNFIVLSFKSIFLVT